ncbi:4'-phosphopantetheinyl transferase superfamily protein [Streptomyces sp. C11-1]|uniref:4'-phosphopantetheinyl transferase superfamily protein n=1 Tax=Streptomyces durocortorensis TaxID=2811104 RepID=A0ABY9W454_9ACTN|nr:4'-phosphopantetheinyl transferase superfamily protein [Streptomyces durocortorensis]WNF29650.1 4'-phosphopantetheinyl transferase superfamily protein [Streptomyces durocortorensis]
MHVGREGPAAGGPGAGGVPAGPLVVVRRSAELLRSAPSIPLTRQERGRLERLTSPGARQDFVAAHVLVRLCAARFIGVPARTLVVRQECAQCAADDHGKPFLPDHPDVGISLSHTRGAVAAAAGRGEVGVDVEETAGASFTPAIARRVLSARELKTVLDSDDPPWTFLRYWVRKEALVKVGATALGRLRDSDLTGTDPTPDTGLDRGRGSVLAGAGAAAGADVFDAFPERCGGRYFLEWAAPDRTLLAAAVGRTPPVLLSDRYTDADHESAPGPGPSTSPRHHVTLRPPSPGKLNSCPTTSTPTGPPVRARRCRADS